MTYTHITLGGGAMNATPGSSQIINPIFFTLPWGDYFYETEQAQKMLYVQMPEAQWAQGVQDHLASHPTSLAVRRWIGRMEVARAGYAAMQASARIPATLSDSTEVDFRVWKDMIEEPWKYGDDIVEWLELDAKVCAGPKRWRTGAFWQEKEDEYVAKEWGRVQDLLAKAALQQQQWHEEALAVAEARRNHLATRIQALWRGYSTRCRQSWRDCSQCLTHGTCVESVNGEPACHECYDESTPDCASQTV